MRCLEHPTNRHYALQTSRQVVQSRLTGFRLNFVYILQYPILFDTCDIFNNDILTKHGEMCKEIVRVGS